MPWPGVTESSLSCSPVRAIAALSKSNIVRSSSCDWLNPADKLPPPKRSPKYVLLLLLLTATCPEFSSPSLLSVREGGLFLTFLTQTLVLVLSLGSSSSSLLSVNAGGSVLALLTKTLVLVEYLGSSSSLLLSD